MRFIFFRVANNVVVQNLYVVWLRVFSFFFAAFFLLKFIFYEWSFSTVYIYSIVSEDLVIYYTSWLSLSWKILVCQVKYRQLPIVAHVCVWHANGWQERFLFFYSFVTWNIKFRNLRVGDWNSINVNYFHLKIMWLVCYVNCIYFVALMKL